MKIPNGTYQAAATDAVTYKSDGGALMIAISFTLSNEGYESERTTSHQCIIRKDGSLSEIGVETLKQCFQWDGANPCQLADSIKAGDYPVDLVIEEESFVGKDGTTQTNSKVKWINPIGGSAAGSLPQAGDEGAIMAEFGATLRAAAGPAKPKAASKPKEAAPKPKSAPPQRPTQTTVQGTEDKAWAACQAVNPVEAAASAAWWKAIDNLFKGRQPKDLSGTDWATLTLHFSDDVPF